MKKGSGKYPELMAPRAKMRPPTPEEAREADELLEKLGVAPEDREEYLGCLAALAEVALEAYFASVKEDRSKGGEPGCLDQSSSL